MSRKYLTAGLEIFNYHMVMTKWDEEVDKILIFIRDYLAVHKGGGFLRNFAKENGLLEKNLTDFSIHYGPGSNPHFRTTYKILRGILKRRPIELEPVQPIITVLQQDLHLPATVRREDYFAVPMVEGRIAAGSGRIVQENVESLVWVYKPEVGNRRNLLAVRLAADAVSMEPTLHPGDIVIIDYQDKILEPPYLFAVRRPVGDQAECAVKRVREYEGRIWLLSDNPAYPPEPSPYGNLEDLIIGRVIYSWTNWLK